MMSDLTVPSMTPQGAVGVCAVVSRLTETFSPHNKTKTKRPALSSLMRTCCIIYTVHVSWTHFSRTLLFLFQSWYCCYPEKNRMWLWFHTFDTLMSLCLSLTLSPLWLLSYVTEPDDVWRTTGEVIMCSDVRGDDPLHGHTLLIRPSTCFFWFPCSFSWSSSGWLTVTGFLSFGHDVSRNKSLFNLVICGNNPALQLHSSPVLSKKPLEKKDVGSWEVIKSVLLFKWFSSLQDFLNS